MTIDRVTSSIDIYSQLRADVSAAGRQTPRQPPPSSDVGSAGSRHSRQQAALSLEVDDRSRKPRWEETDAGDVVPFEQPATALADEQTGPEYGATAQEVPLTLEVVNAQRNPLLAQAAILYLKTGRPDTSAAGLGTVGTRLNAVA